MGRSYNLKNSPINKGTAAKPSPMKEPVSFLAGLGAGVSALFTGGAVGGAATAGTAAATSAAVIGKGLTATALATGLQQGTKGIKNKRDAKIQQEQTRQETERNIHANMQKGLTKDISMNRKNLLGD